MTRVIWDHFCEEEAIGVGDDETSTSLSYASFIALRDATKCGCVRGRLHAGHINDIESTLFFYGKNRQRVNL